MISDTIVLLGIPIDNVTMDETFETIFAMINEYRYDGRPRLIATVNVDFVVNTLGWRLGKNRHPELLEILRRADLVTADGMPLVWVSKLLGSPLPERVAGSDMVPRLAKEAAQRHLSLYFLGGRDGVAQNAAEILQSSYPDLHIAGVNAPFVAIHGKELTDADTEDQIIVEQINQSRPDILLIAFGNPKQEIWFNRNRHRLQVPVSIGVGATFDFITGSVVRAPEWMQRAGLEWLFRITQDPGRLWKRYLLDFAKFGTLVWPSIIYYRLVRWHWRLTQKQGNFVVAADRDSTDGLTGKLQIIVLPERLDAPAAKELREKVESALTQDQLIFDFSSVAFIDSSGLGLLIRAWRQADAESKNIYFVKVPQKIRLFFQLNRSLDIFQDKIVSNLDEVLSLRDQQQTLTFQYFLESDPNYKLLHLVGRLDAKKMADLDINSLLEKVDDHHCILNLKNLRFVDSAGLSLFLRLQRHLSSLGNNCVFYGLDDNVRQVFRITKLDHLLKSTVDLREAEKMVQALS
jgi:N-acetylglucosaminyldiphosphoundecaprenol N-acetyl-beta-D-mannosaminyltransferase